MYTISLIICVLHEKQNTTFILILHSTENFRLLLTDNEICLLV